MVKFFIFVKSHFVVRWRWDRDREVATDENLNFSAVRSPKMKMDFSAVNFSAVLSPIGLKLCGDLGLVSQISVHVLVSRVDSF
jgi:hypothetical protein